MFDLFASWRIVIEHLRGVLCWMHGLKDISAGFCSVDVPFCAEFCHPKRLDPATTHVSSARIWHECRCGGWQPAESLCCASDLCHQSSQFGLLAVLLRFCLQHQGVTA